MKIFRNLLTVLLVLSALLSLCACGSVDTDATEPASGETTEAVQPSETTEATQPALQEGMTAYTVTVVDEGGNPIAGAMVQMCKDTCYPAATDANGTAQFTLAEDTYKVSFLVLPAGYDYVDETQEFYFADGATELTIVLKAVA